MGKRKWKTRVSPDPPPSLTPSGDRGLCDCLQRTAGQWLRPRPSRSRRLIVQTTKVACPLVPSRAEQAATRAAEQMGNGFVDFVLNLKSVSWYCHEIDLFTLECMFVSSVYYQELWVFFSKVIWSYKINLQNNSNEWPKSEKDIFRLSFRLECTKKITNNSNSFSFCFYLLNYGMLRLLFGKKKNRVIFWSKFWTQAAFLRCVNTEEIATEILPPNFKLQRLQRATGRNIFLAFPTSALRSSSS